MANAWDPPVGFEPLRPESPEKHHLLPAGQGAPEPHPLAFLNRGLATAVGGPVDLLNWAASPATKALGIYHDAPLGGSRNLSGIMGAALGEGVVAPEDAVAKGYASRAAEGVGLGVGSLLPGGAVAGQLRSAASPMVRGVATQATNPFISTPGRAVATDIVAGAGAGAGGLAAEKKALNAGVDPDLARIAGEFVGGFGAGVAPGAAASALGRGAAKLPVLGWAARNAAPYTKAGAAGRAQERAQGLVADPETTAANIKGDTLGGLTPAVESGDPRLMALERQMRRDDPVLDARLTKRAAQTDETLRGAIRGGDEAVASDATRYIQQHRDRLTGLVEERVAAVEARAQEAISKLSPEMLETEASIIVRKELDAALGSARAEERRLWGLVPDDVLVPTENAKAAFLEYQGQLAKAQLDDLPEKAARFLGPEKNSAFGLDETVKEMAGLRSELLKVSRQARASGEPNQARIADGIADAILKDLESVDGVGGIMETARGWSRSLNETFRRGRVGNVLGYAREGGASLPPEMTLGTTIGRSGASGAVAADELQAALKGQPDANAAMTDFLRRRFSNASDQGKFLAANDELLNRFPELKAEMASAVTEGTTARELRSIADVGLAEAAKAPGAAFVKADVEKEFATLLSRSQDPKAAFRALARTAATDKTGQATKGLKAAAYDHLIDKAGKGGELSGKSIRAALADKRTRAALSEILDPEDMRRLGRVAGELDKVAMSKGGLPEVGEVMNDPVNRVIDVLGRVIGSRTGVSLAKSTGGQELVLAGFFSRKAQEFLKGMTNSHAERLLRASFEDPEMLKALLQPVNSPAAAAQVERRLVAFMAAEAGQAIDAAGGRPEATEAPPAWASPEGFEPTRQNEPPSGFAPLRSSVAAPDQSIAAAGASAPIPAGVAKIATSPTTPIELARSFIGQSEAKNARPLSAFITRMTGRAINVQETPWCAAFVNAVLKGSGSGGTGKLNARSFLNFGTPADKPQLGDVAVFSRGDPKGWKGHVGFYAGEVEKNGQTFVRVVGGNQDDSVSEKLYEKSRLLGYRRPPTVKVG